MASWKPTLIEVLHPPCFESNPIRAGATRTVIQPDIDAFEQAEARLAAVCSKRLFSEKHGPNGSVLAGGAQ